MVDRVNEKRRLRRIERQRAEVQKINQEVGELESLNWIWFLSVPDPSKPYELRRLAWWTSLNLCDHQK